MRVGQAALTGWRAKVADAVAPRLPVDDTRARSLAGIAFLALSLRYIVRTFRRAARGTGS